MDTQDRDQELDSPRVMLPDTSMEPPQLLDLADGAAGTAVALALQTEKEAKKPKKAATPLQDSLRQLRRDTRAMVSIGVIAFFVLLAAVGPVIYQHIGGVYQSPFNGAVPASVYHSFAHQELTRLDELPSAQYWLGTDDLGRAVLARLM